MARRRVDYKTGRSNKHSGQRFPASDKRKATPNAPVLLSSTASDMFCDFFVVPSSLKSLPDGEESLVANPKGVTRMNRLSAESCTWLVESTIDLIGVTTDWARKGEATTKDIGYHTRSLIKLAKFERGMSSKPGLSASDSPFETSQRVDAPHAPSTVVRRGQVHHFRPGPVPRFHREKRCWGGV